MGKNLENPDQSVSMNQSNQLLLTFLSSKCKKMKTNETEVIYLN